MMRINRYESPEALNEPDTLMTFEPVLHHALVPSPARIASPFFRCKEPLLPEERNQRRITQERLREIAIGAMALNQRAINHLI